MESPLRLCVGDIGSNAIKARIVEVTDAGTRTLSETRYPVRLGASVFKSDSISEEALKAAVQAFQELAMLCGGFGVSRTRIVATSATREAGNRCRFLEEIRSATGLRVEIISGREEARLLAAGVRPEMKPATPNLVIDVGGGSTEIIYTRSDQQVRAVHTLRLGAVRLARGARSGKEGKLGKKGLSLLRDEIATILDRAPLPVIARSTHAIGVAGTMGAILSAKYRGQTEVDNTFTAGDLNELIGEMRDLDSNQIEKKFGLDQRRAQVILPGALIVAGIMDLYSLEQITVSCRGLRDGLLEEMLSGVQTCGVADTEDAVIRIGEKYEFDRAHGEQVARLAVSLFDQLEPVHQLPGGYRDLLRYGALLHDIGQFISYGRHHRHACYLISGEEIPGLTALQKQVVAAIARYHRKAPPKARHREFATLPEEDREAVERCAAILRLADALDSQHRQLVADLRVESGEDGVNMTIEARGSVSLEVSKTARKSQWFARVFGMRVTVNVCEDNDDQEAG